MTEQPATYSSDRDDDPTLLYRECVQVIGQLYRHRLNRKLLRAALSGLQMIAGYKADRAGIRSTTDD